MKHSVSLEQLERRFPTDEYGRPGTHYVESYNADQWFDHAGLCQEERSQFGSLFLASLPGDFSDGSLVGIFGCYREFPPVNPTLVTIWWGGELTPAFQEACAYWAEERAKQDSECPICEHPHHSRLGGEFDGISCDNCGFEGPG